ncbi:MAG: HAMP domain-containing histidine kinase [Planctomycetes bacterium]|nr:HAMP domain-containing histidine kinase [Planctomycetota bacterium]
MDAPARIAVVGPVDDGLVGTLRSLPLAPTVREWSALCTDSEAIARFQPTLVFVALSSDAPEEIGALRVLQNLWPHTSLALVTSPAREAADAPLAQRLRLRLVVFPSVPGTLADAVEQAFHGTERTRHDVFTDLARGVADEVNNPLMFVAGQLQLLRGTFDPAADRDRRDRLTTVLDGVKSIQRVMDRLRLVAQAVNGPRRTQPVDLAALLGVALAERQRAAMPAPNLRIADGVHVVNGDAEQIAAAIGAIATFAHELANIGVIVDVSLDAAGDARRMRITAAGPALATWTLPASFEPYYPNRALRGHGFGFGLFLAQTVVLGHRGQATARRRPDGSLQIDFSWPK